MDGLLFYSALKSYSLFHLQIALWHWQLDWSSSLGCVRDYYFPPDTDNVRRQHRGFVITTVSRHLMVYKSPISQWVENNCYQIFFFFTVFWVSEKGKAPSIPSCQAIIQFFFHTLFDPNSKSKLAAQQLLRLYQITQTKNLGFRKYYHIIIFLHFAWCFKVSLQQSKCQ